MKILRLKKNKKLSLDNRESCLESLKRKFHEEGNEVIEAIGEFQEEPSISNLMNLLMELFDVIQIITSIFYNLESKGVIKRGDLETVNMIHNNKLKDREWECDGSYFIARMGSE